MADYGGQNKWQEIAGGLGEGMGYLGQQMQQNTALKQQQQMELQKMLLDMDKAALTKGFVRTTLNDEKGVDLFGTKNYGILYRPDPNLSQADTSLDTIYTEDMASRLKSVNPAVPVKAGDTQRYVNSLQQSALIPFKADIALQKDAVQAVRDGAQQALSAVVRMEDIEKAARDMHEVYKIEPGLLEQMYAVSSAQWGKITKDPVVMDLAMKLDGNITSLARSYGEEKGPLQNKDIDRAMMIIGDASLPFGTRVKALDDVRKSMAYSWYGKADTAGLSEEQIKKSHEALYNRFGGSVRYQAYQKWKAEPTNVYKPAPVATPQLGTTPTTKTTVTPTTPTSLNTTWGEKAAFSVSREELHKNYPGAEIVEMNVNGERVFMAITGGQK